MSSAGPWSELPGGVRVRQSRAFHMNSVLLLDRAHALIVDPGVLPSELDALAAATREARAAEVTLIFTHAHWDHVLGAPWWPGARRVAHDRFAAEVREKRAEIAREAEALAATRGEIWPAPFVAFAPDLAVSGLHFTRFGDWRVVFRDAPGHSDSQLTLHFPELALLLSADMLSDVEIPMLDRPPAIYRRTLEGLLPLAQGGAFEWLVPGHGSVARGADDVIERLLRDLAYLERLERGARECRARGLDAAGAAAALPPWEDVERHPGYPMGDVHRENVEIAFRALDTARA
jgi:glyoxylase-like metal-dependent hydrolase (beta-lactamase superfamily II)